MNETTEKLKMAIPFWWIFNDVDYPKWGAAVLTLIDLIVLGAMVLIFLALV